MALVDRVKNILLTPAAEWPKIAEEPATTQSIYVGYIVILAAIGPVAMALRGGMFMLAPAILSYAIALGATFVLAWIVDALAPTFGGEKDFVGSLKLAAYSWTAAWIAGIFQLLPFIGGIIGLLAMIYSFYTFYLGAPVMKKCTPEKAAGYTMVVVICAIVLFVLVGGVLMSTLVGDGMTGMGMLR